MRHGMRSIVTGLLFASAVLVAMPGYIAWTSRDLSSVRDSRIAWSRPASSVDTRGNATLSQAFEAIGDRKNLQSAGIAAELGAAVSAGRISSTDQITIEETVSRNRRALELAETATGQAIGFGVK